MAYRVLAKWPQPGACPHLLICRAWSPKTKETIPTWLLCLKTVQDGRTSRNNPIKRGKWGERLRFSIIWASSVLTGPVFCDLCWYCHHLSSIFLLCSSIASIPQLPELQPQPALQKSVSNLQKPSPVANQEVCMFGQMYLSSRFEPSLRSCFKYLALIWVSGSPQSVTTDLHKSSYYILKNYIMPLFGNTIHTVFYKCD